MKKFLIIVLLLGVSVVGGVVTLALMSFNPSAYERDVVAYLQKLTGRDVSIGGTTAISWNPEPTVTLNNIKISNIDKSQNPVMLSVEKMTVAIAWKSLLKSPLEIKRIDLVKPILHLERLESNRANFTFPFLLDPNFQLQEVAMLADSSSAATKIESVEIHEGTIDYANQITGADIQVTNINGSLSVDSVRGPFRFKGTGIAGKGQYAVSSNIGAFQGATPVPVRVQLSENNTRFELTLSGNFTPLGLDKWFDGSAEFNIGRLDGLLSDMGWPIPDLSAGAVADGSSTVIIAPALDTLKNFVIKIGEGDQKSAFTGTLTRTISGKKYAYDVDVETDLFRISQWQSYINLLDWNWLSGEKEYPSVHFKVMAESVPFKAEAVQKLVMEGSYVNNTLSVENGTAALPDGGKVAFNILGKPQNQDTRLEWGIRAEMPSVQGVLKWLMGDEKITNLPVLAQKGSFTGRVILDPKTVTVSADEFNIGETVVTGAVQKALTDQGGYIAKLTIGNVNLDSYTGWTPAEKAIALAELPAKIQGALKGVTGLKGMNIDAVLDISNATLFGAPVGRLYTESVLDNQVLTIERLIAQNMAGADVAVAARVRNIGSAQAAVDAVQLGMKTKQLPAFLKRMNLASVLPLINQAADATFRATVKSGKDGLWAIDTVADLSNASIKLKGGLVADEPLSLQDMAFEVMHPNFQTFMKLMDPAFNALPKLDGTFKATGVLTGNKEYFDFKDTTVAVGLQKLSGTVSLDNRQMKTLTANVMAPSLDLERFTSDTNPFYSEVNGLSKKVFDLSALNDWNWNLKLNAAQLIYKDIAVRQADLQMTLQNKELNLVKLTGTSGSSDKSPVNLSAKLDWNTTPTFVTSFDLQNIPLKQDFMVLQELAMGGGALSVKGELKARGETPADLVTALNGQGTILLKGGQMIGVDVEQMIPIITRAIQRSEGAKVIEPEFKRVLNSGKTVLGTLSGDYVISNGVVRMMDLTMETGNSVANPTQIVWDIPKRTLDISIPVLLKPLNSLPPFILGISVSAGRGIYKPNYADLLAVLSNRSQTALANDLRQKEEAARASALQKRSDRLAESKKLTTNARRAVQQMEQKMAEFPFEKGRRLLASAKDTLTLLNQLAVKEDPTDAQLIQQIEYARTVLLRADEFNQALEQETLFYAQKKVAEYRQKSVKFTDQLKAWQAGYPDILVLQKLAATAEQNRQIVEDSAKKLTPNLSVNEANELLAEMTAAVEKIEEAYQHATRFDLSGVPNQVAGEAPKTHQVKGSFKKSE